MADYAFRMIHNNGLTTAVNDTVTGSSKFSPITGTSVAISVGAASGAYIRFGGPADTVSSSNGFLLPAGSLTRFSVPGSINIHYIQLGATATTISLQFGDGGI